MYGGSAAHAWVLAGAVALCPCGVLAFQVGQVCLWRCCLSAAA